MVVPYGDPSPARFWQNYFDTGEYVFGRYANSLVLAQGWSVPGPPQLATFAVLLLVLLVRPRGVR